MGVPDRLSRYRFSSAQADAAGRLFLDDPRPFRFQNLADNRRHLVAEGDTLWGLAARYFAPIPRPAGLWWVIAHFNGVHDPTVALTPGSVLTVPSLRTVQELIFNERRRREEA